MVSSPLVLIIIAASIVSALNPCTIGVLIMLMSAILGKGHQTSRAFWLGLTFIITTIAASLVLGVCALYLFHQVPLIPAEYLAIGVGILVVCAGLIEIKYYFWYGKGLGLRLGSRATASIKSLTKKRATIPRAAWLGTYTAIVSLPCTGAAYLAVITILRDSFDYTSLQLLGIYNLLFVLPLVICVGLIASGVKLNSLQHWKEEGKGKMRLGVGLLLVALGWIIILIANGVLNFE